MATDEVTPSQSSNSSEAKFDAIRSNNESRFSNAHIVYFHLDTTVRNVKTCEILQIAAWCNGKRFQEYMLPENSFGENDHNGFRFNSINGTLYHYEKEVKAVPTKDGLVNFMKFLSDVSGNTRNVLLAANNCSSFFRHAIVNIIKHYNLLDTFKSLVLGFIDTIDVFKSALPDRKKKASFGLDELAQEYLGKNICLEKKDAVVYVDTIIALIQAFESCNDELMKQNVSNLDEFLLFIDLKVNLAASDTLLKKIAAARITVDMLKVAYKSDPKDGISNYFKEKIGNPRSKQKEEIGEITKKVSVLVATDVADLQLNIDNS